MVAIDFKFQDQVAVVGLKANHHSTAVPSPNNGARMPLPKRAAAANFLFGRFLEDVDLERVESLASMI